MLEDGFPQEVVCLPSRCVREDDAGFCQLPGGHRRCLGRS
uniref:Uncharacterized protein n=1 Tax=Rhizophora mucronata TaxID=61149 RepID=A0A2P2QKM2_RHIMU